MQEKSKGFKHFLNFAFGGLISLEKEEAFDIMKSESGNDDLGKLMHDFCSSEAEKMYYALMSETTKYYKESHGVNEMCKSIEELCHQAEKWGEARGEARGIEKSKAEILAKMKELNYPKPMIEQIFGEAVAEQQ